jgi:hypothetical protein
MTTLLLRPNLAKRHLVLQKEVMMMLLLLPLFEYIGVKSLLKLIVFWTGLIKTQ